MVLEMKRKIEMVEDDVPRRLPPPERESRRLRQVGELAGLQLSGKYECAHSQIVKAVQMLEDNVIRYLGVDECVKRE
jgi:hypothetical protein